MKERLALKLKRFPFDKHFWDSGTHWILGSSQAQKKNQPTFFKGLKTHTRKKTLVKQNGLKKKQWSVFLPCCHHCILIRRIKTSSQKASLVLRCQKVVQHEPYESYSSNNIYSLDGGLEPFEKYCMVKTASSSPNPGMNSPSNLQGEAHNSSY